MDEQAGPGVFFNNNNNSLLSAGTGPGGAGKGFEAGAADAASVAGGGGGGSAGRAQYSIPGILHFLQHEWARFEVERAQWEVERAEMQAQIAFLQGERKGQENLKKDLVRRIKMLEYALKQERAKYHKLKYGTELNQGDMKPPNYDSENAAAEFSDEEDEEENESRDKTIIDSATEDQCPITESWNVDQGVITKLKEQYKKERKGKKGVKRPNRSKLQDMLANLREVDELPSLQPSVVSSSRPASSRISEQEINRADEVEALTFPPSSGKSFIMGADEALENELGLGELAGLTVANEADSLTYDIANNKDALRKTWNPKFTLRSHFDGIRGLAFHPSEPVLITASEDHTLKMWNLQKTAPAKKSTSLDIEPIYTFRAHRGPVLCVVMSTNGEQCYSGGTDGVIQSWNTPNSNVDPYDSYDPTVLRGAYEGHTDAVWGLVYSAVHQRLLSAAADGTIRIWNATEVSPALSIFNENQELGIPSSVDLVSCDPAHLVASFNNGHTNIFNMETHQKVLTLESCIDTAVNSTCQINRVISHPTLPISITAHEDRHIKFYDNNTGKLIHSMVAHLDAVTSLAVDPNGLYLMSGSHDCSIRLWNLESKTCIQEFTAHRKKSDESIHDVAFHPSKCYIASAGADALAKVFV
ncbi:hypothetical protein XELAEV_18026762mg [Xenopus laevis]|uniref:Striatin n=1 Tax=Xenopus laevis TaxID=8355 RepID=A0A974CWR2_XENLA|nr:hypothetical protein XELAEV_18026762mg [Xenopus laevis]